MSIFDKETLKIGNKTYSVIKVDKVISNDSVVLGKITYDYQNINISNSYPIETQEETLVHEIVHGLLIEYNLDALLEKSDNIDEEMFVDVLGKALYRFILENMEEK